MDLTMCKGGGCKQKGNCLRYKGRANTRWQAYFAGVPAKQGECDYFIPYLNDTVKTLHKARKRLK